MSSIGHHCNWVIAPFFFVKYFTISIELGRRHLIQILTKN